MAWYFRLFIVVAIESIIALLCVNITAAGLANEEVAEMVHGSLGTILSLWLFGFLSFSRKLPA